MRTQTPTLVFLVALISIYFISTLRPRASTTRTWRRVTDVWTPDERLPENETATTLPLTTNPSITDAAAEAKVSWYRCPSPAISGDVELCKSFAHVQKHPAEHARCLSFVVDSLCGSTAVPLLELSGYTIVGYSSLEHAIQRVAPPKTLGTVESIAWCLSECLRNRECVGFEASTDMRSCTLDRTTRAVPAKGNVGRVSYLLPFQPPLPRVPRPGVPSYLVVTMGPRRFVSLPSSSVGEPLSWPPVVVECRDTFGHALSFGSVSGAGGGSGWVNCSLSVVWCPPRATVRALPALLWSQTVVAAPNASFVRVDGAGPAAIDAQYSGCSLEHRFVFWGPRGTLLTAARKYWASLAGTRLAVGDVGGSKEKRHGASSELLCKGMKLDTQRQCCYPTLIVGLKHELSGRLLDVHVESLENAFIKADLVSSDDAAGSVALIAGTVSHVSSGHARFTHLVFEFSRPVPSSAAELKGANATLRFSFERGDRDWLANYTLPLTAIVRECTKASFVPHGTVKTAKSKDPVLVSTALHECMSCAKQLAQNVRVFVRPSVLVVHVSPRFRDLLGADAAEQLRPFHPRTYVNPKRTSGGGLYIFMAHVLNMRYALQNLLWTNFTHVLVMSSNELYMRPGVVDYIRRFDCVEMSPPDASAGLVYEHYRESLKPFSHFNDCEYLTADELLLDPRQPWWYLQANTWVEDKWMRETLRRQGLFRFPSSAMFNEGAFYSVSITREVVAAFAWFDEASHIDDVAPYPSSELYPQAALQDVCQRPAIRCGHRVSTVVWRNVLRSRRKGKVIRVWTVTMDDVRQLRKSVFEVPFALKRVLRDLSDPVRAAVVQLAEEERNFEEEFGMERKGQ